MEYTIDSNSRLQVEKELFAGLTSSVRPTIFVMAGIPGAGKTTFVNKMLAEGVFPNNAFILSPDRVMEALPTYQKDFVELGAEEAFQRWELPARKLAYDFYDMAVANGMDIIQDMGGARWEIYEMLKGLKEQHGYRLQMYWLNTPIEVALARIAQRPRYTSARMVWERYNVLQSLKSLYLRLCDCFTQISLQ